jgi:diguanylate cyclase (GGDEF)-like protein/PAS domain S-box-containing protein
VNGAWERALGFTREELTSTPFIEFVHPDDRERTRAEGKAVLEGLATPGFRNRWRTKGGEYRWLEWSTHHTDEGQLYCVVRDVTERARMEDELRKLAVTDPLTGLNNRREFTALAKREVARTNRYGQKLSFALVDADHFKTVNDKHGHAAGDEVLRALARCMRGALRETDVVARWGGEEFVALLLETGEREALEAAERIRSACEQLAIDYAGSLIRVTVSVGVSTLRDGEGGLEGMLERADRALYAAKEEGRNRVEFES